MGVYHRGVGESLIITLHTNKSYIENNQNYMKFVNERKNKFWKIKIFSLQHIN